MRYYSPEPKVPAGPGQHHEGKYTRTARVSLGALRFVIEPPIPELEGAEASSLAELLEVAAVADASGALRRKRYDDDQRLEWGGTLARRAGDELARPMTPAQIAGKVAELFLEVGHRATVVIENQFDFDAFVVGPGPAQPTQPTS